ncbi:hypothetical protein ACOSQ4_027093 [Xanthoceras sorbifolium]
MKCCSLKRKDLNHHFKKMSHKYNMLNDLKDIFLGEIHQMALFEKVCRKPYLKIECKLDKCSCQTKIKKHFLPKEGRKNRRFRYFRKK